MWFDGPPPDVYHEWISSWKDLHPEWEYRLWQLSDIHNLIKTNYSWFLKTYEKYETSLEKNDAGRYFILHHHGGLYCDVDIQCFRPIDTLIESGCVLFEHDLDHCYKHIYPTGMITNSLMYSDRHNPFMHECIEGLRLSKLLYSNIKCDTDRAMHSTSTLYLTDKYNQTYNNVTLKPHVHFESLSREERHNQINQEEHQVTNDMYGIHWNVGSHLKNTSPLKLKL